MTSDDYAAYVAVSDACGVRDTVAAGIFTPDQAGEAITAMRQRSLPGGLSTPGHHFYVIRSAATGDRVGSLWYTTKMAANGKQGYVMDIQIDPEQRGRGLGRAAFAAIERLAASQGCVEMGLTVFGHNAVALAMYRKLGYAETIISMRKVFEATPPARPE